MTVFGVFFLSLIVLCSCTPKEREFTTVDELTEEEFGEFYAELDGESLNYMQFKGIVLDKIYKKAHLKDPKVNDSLFNINKQVIRLYTKDYLIRRK